MKKSPVFLSQFRFTGLLLAFSLTLTACQGALLSESGTSFQPQSVSATDCSYGGRIRSVEALDASTVRFTLCSPDAAFPEELANPIFSVQDSAFLDANGGASSAMSVTPNGTGPYRIQEYVGGDHITFERNMDYWGQPPRSGLVYLSWAGDPFQRYSSLRFNLADVIDAPAPEDYTAILNDTNLQLQFRPATNIFYVGFNHSIAPFDNLQFRLGVATAIDRSAIVSEEFPQGSVLAEQFIPPTFSPGYTTGLSWYDYDFTGAHEILAGTNFDFSQHIALYYPNFTDPYLPSPASTAAHIARQLGLLGVRVNVVPMQPTEFSRALQAGELSFFLNYLIAGYPDASYFYNQSLTGNSLEFGEPYPELVDALRLASATTDSVIRQAAYDTANSLIKDLVVLVPVAHLSSALASRVAYENVVAGAFSENITEMGGTSDRLGFMQSSEPISLWPGDETDTDSFRVAQLLYDTLTEYDPAGVGITPGLAVSWQPNDDLTQWTFSLRYHVTYTNGAIFDANDVVASFAALWDASSPNHIGHTGEFALFRSFFGNFLNASQN